VERFGDGHRLACIYRCWKYIEASTLNLLSIALTYHL
jgi:hypothetical protein